MTMHKEIKEAYTHRYTHTHKCYSNKYLKITL
jgi:hypothetical protein